MQTYDVIIIGGGCVGLAMAHALRPLNLRVALLEGRKLTVPTLEDSYDSRVYAVNHASENLLRELNVWDDIKNSRACQYYHMTVWEKDLDQAIHFDRSEVAKSHLGHIIEDRIIRHALLKDIKQFTSCFDNITIEKLSYHDNHWQIDDAYKTTLLIGADGANSFVRKALGIKCDERAYHQDALVTTVHMTKPHQHTAWQHFLPTGPLALLPLEDDNLCSIVWSTTNDEANELKAIDESAFNHRLQKAFGNHLGELTVVGPRLSFPLKRRHAERYVQDGATIIGDAAHTIHPLAGLGMNLGLEDVAALANQLTKTPTRYLGHPHYLNRYARARRGRVSNVITAMAGFHALFSNDNPYLKTLRNTGLNIANHFPTFKRLAIEQALG